MEQNKPITTRSSKEPMEITPEEREAVLKIVTEHSVGVGSLMVIGAKRRDNGLVLDWISMNLRPRDLLNICGAIIRDIARDMGKPPATLSMILTRQFMEEWSNDKPASGDADVVPPRG
jgi:hypothetical protein